VNFKNIDGYVTITTHDVNNTSKSITSLHKTPTVRANSTAYALGDWVSVGNGRWYECTTAGTTSGSPPVFGLILHGTTADGSVVWTMRNYYYITLQLDSAADIVAGYAFSIDWWPGGTGNDSTSPFINGIHEVVSVDLGNNRIVIRLEQVGTTIGTDVVIPAANTAVGYCRVIRSVIRPSGFWGLSATRCNLYFEGVALYPGNANFYASNVEGSQAAILGSVTVAQGSTFINVGVSSLSCYENSYAYVECIRKFLNVDSSAVQVWHLLGGANLYTARLDVEAVVSGIGQGLRAERSSLVNVYADCVVTNCTTGLVAQTGSRISVGTGVQFLNVTTQSSPANGVVGASGEAVYIA
jgi:hypothetical protein